MDGEVTRYRSSWKRPDADEPSRTINGRYAGRPSPLTKAQERWLLKAYLLRQRLKDAGLAAHLGLTRGQLMHALLRVRDRRHG